MADERGVTFGLRKVYFQVADTSQGANPSASVSASVVFAPSQLSPHTLTGAELQQFLSLALDAGYKFTAGSSSAQLFEGSRSRPFTDTDCPPEAPEMLLGPSVFGGFRFVQDDTIRIFDGPPLNAFWKITNVVITPKTDQLLAGSVASVSATSSQGLQQLPFRTVTIRSEIKVGRLAAFDNNACSKTSMNFRLKLIPPLVTSLTIEGPSGFNVRDALPPRN